MHPDGSVAVMAHSSWNTTGELAHRQFDFYRQGMCEAFAHLSPIDPARGQEFAASIDIWTGDQHSHTLMAAPTHLVQRTKSDIAAAADEDFYLNYMIEGHMELSQSFGDTLIGPGDMMMVDNGQVYTARIDARNGHRHLAFRFRRTDFPEHVLTDFGRFNRHPLSGYLRQNLLFLAGPSCTSDPRCMALAADMIVSLVDLIAADKSQAPANRLRRVLDRLVVEIRRNLDRSTYKLSDAASTLGLSPRALQAHLATENLCFSHLLSDHRLQAAYLQLSTGNPRTSVDSIALDHGFEALPSFHRAFRRKYGCTPGSVRPARYS